MAKKRYRVTTQGYLVLSVLLVIIIAILLIAIFSCAPQDRGDALETPGPTLPTQAPPDPTQDPYADLEDTPDPYGQGTPGMDIPSMTNTPPAPEVTNTPMPTVPSGVMTTPSADMMNKATGGELSKGDVNMRQGPGTEYAVVKKGLKKGTSLTIYTEVNGWYFLKLNSDNTYGYIRKDMVKLNGQLGAAATPEPEAPPNTVRGTLNSTVVLRSAPTTADDSNKIKEFYAGQVVYIEYKETGSDGKVFYYLTVAGTSYKGYMWATLIKVNGTVPDKTPD
ncbi:MAG: SH3 domain-containing protein [Clostridiales bacterium]|nr:SH3 domain-containing protein [Clostridiales bacterium]